MNTNEINERLVKAQQEIEECKRLLKEPTITVKERMKELWRSCTKVKYSTDNCRTYYSEDEKIIIQQDWKNKKLYYSSDLYYIINNEFNLSINDINKLIIDTVSKDLNCPGLGLWRSGSLLFFKIKSLS
jgi:hypothetical protein